MTMEKIDVMLEPVRIFLHQVADLLPRLGLALVILIIGYFVARAVKFVIVKALRAGNFHVLSDRAGIDGFLRDGGVGADTTDIIGTLCYWIVILAALIIGFNGLGLNYITDLLVKVLLFVPKVIVAVVILAFGSYFARFLGNALCAYAKKLQLQDAELLGKLAQYAIATFVVLIALDQMEIGGDIVRQTFLIVLAGVVLALALAFGIGGKDWAAELLERWWPRNNRKS
jgi:flagellar biosynthesis protein FliQ